MRTFELVTCIVGAALVCGFVGWADAKPVDGQGDRAARGIGVRHRVAERIKERFDVNRDGVLDDSERSAARDAIRQRIIARLDANGDGKIDQSERPRDAARNFRRGLMHRPLIAVLLMERADEFDANKDGRLDENERAAARESLHQEVLNKFDANQNGVIDDVERTAVRESIHQQILQRFDTNGNGAIDDDERQAARETLRQELLKRFDANGNGVIDQDERPRFQNRAGRINQSSSSFME